MTTMQAIWRQSRWDGLGLGIAGLCLMHCLATSVLLAIFASVGGALFSPLIHEVGLVFAILFGAIALVRGMLAHRFVLPAAIGAIGIGVMIWALTLPHGGGEIAFTMLGVAILALGHFMNVRAARRN
ncbi:MAG: MerC domain-containing protein [Sphingomonadales bacterium]